jgi:RNA polymerase sigma-70 factor, ECF subfamily
MDVRVAMPPSPSWYRGRDDVLEFLAEWVWTRGKFRLVAASYNAQPAFLTSLATPGQETLFAIEVLTVDRDGISAIDFFGPEVSATSARAVG